MYAWGRISAILSLSMVCLCACKAGTQAPTPLTTVNAPTQTPTPLTTINAPQGGKIVYGPVNGATTQGAAMAKMLSTVHNNSGEKPQIGRVFQFTGTNLVGVFFTVTDHPDGNLPLAGMVIAAATGPNQVEAAMVYDLASRFGQTVNPMLQQLSGVWHPGASSPAAGTAPASAGNGGGSVPASQGGSNIPLHPVSAPDNSASVGIPDGWTLDPNSGHGAIVVHGPNGEQIGLELMKGAIDPTHPFRARSDAHGQLEGPPGAVVIYPYRGDPAKEFEGILQAWRTSNSKGPVKLQGLKTQIVTNIPNPNTNQCVTADGQVDLQDGTGMQKLGALLCIYNDQTTFKQWGNYVITFYQLNYEPMAVAQKDSALISAITNTYKQNSQVMQQQGQQMMAQKQQSDQQIMAQSQAAVDRIHQIGAQATARMNATEAANSTEQSSWEAGQNANARNAQGFSNYLLDQSVVQNNYTGAHATTWNSAAEGLVKADPNKYSYVNTPNYIPGTDY